MAALLRPGRFCEIALRRLDAGGLLSGAHDGLGSTAGITAAATVVAAPGVWVATLNRPHVLNAVGIRLAQEVVELGRALAELATAASPRDEDAVRAVVLVGSGRAFSTGRDLKESKTHTPEQADLFQDLVRQSTDIWEAMPVPTIAAVHGPCYGWVCACQISPWRLLLGTHLSHIL